MALSSQETGLMTAACHAAFDRWERFAGSPAGTGLMLCWALGEATVWPIIPDVLLAPLCAVTKRRYHRVLAGGIAGMALGGIGLYLFSYRDAQEAQSLLRRLPLVNERQIETAQRSLAAHGAVGFLYQPLSGSPFKVWAIEAGSQGIAPWPAIPLFIVARSTRMVVVAMVAHALGDAGHRYARDYSLFIAGSYVAVFFAGWWAITLR